MLAEHNLAAARVILPNHVGIITLMLIDFLVNKAKQFGVMT